MPRREPAPPIHDIAETLTAGAAKRVRPELEGDDPAVPVVGNAVSVTVPTRHVHATVVAELG